MIALFGGTFNPPHYGHLKPVQEVMEELNINEIRLLPAPQPPHKLTKITPLKHRIKMLQLLCEDDKRLVIDKTELGLPLPSYSVQTLAYFRDQHVSTPIIFIIGEDSLRTIHSWFEWQRLTDLCHIVVMRRRNETNSLEYNPEIKTWLHKVETKIKDDLFSSPFGHVFFAETRLWDVSSTDIRHAYISSDGENGFSETADSMLPKSIRDYIELHHLYKKTT